MSIGQARAWRGGLLLAGAVALACAVAQAQPDAAAGQAVRYDGHKVVRVVTRDAGEFALMNQISPDPWDCRPGIGTGER